MVSCWVQLFSGFIVCYFIGEYIQIFEGDPGLQVLARFGQGAELLIGCHHVLIAVLLRLFALLIREGGGEIAGPVDIDVSVDLTGIEFSKIRGVLLRDVCVTIELADDRAIFTFNQAIAPQGTLS